MHNFRKSKPQQSTSKAIDGFLSAPQRPLQSSPSAQHGLGIERFRSAGGRQVGDFRRAEGYHPVTRAMDRPLQTVGRPAPTTTAVVPSGNRSPQTSILHMTLPGSGLDGAPDSGSRRSRKKAHRKSLSKWRRIARWSLRTGLVTAALVLVIGGFLVTKGYFKLHKVLRGGGTAVALQSNIKPELLKGEGDGRVNILLLGKGGGNHDGPDLTDTLLVVSIDPVNKTANMVSIPRDLWVTPSGFGSMKINAVYANQKYKDLATDPKNTQKAEDDGVALIEQQVTQVLGIPIHYYGMIDFAAFQQAVNTVGGVDINVAPENAVSDNMYNEDTHKPYYLNVTAGPQHFDGLRALMYVRTRHTSARGDFDRTERQRSFIEALSSKILTAGTYTNPVKVSGLLSDFGDNVSTDFSVSDSLRLATIMKQIGTNHIISIGLADPPNNYVRTDSVDGLSIVRPTAGVGDYSEIQNYIRNTLKDPYLATENATITVLNGTATPGLAAAKAAELKSYGYNVVTVDSAPTQTYTHTVLVDTSGGKKPFTKNYLQKRLGVQATTKLPDPAISATTQDFVIILGQDETAHSQN